MAQSTHIKPNTVGRSSDIMEDLERQREIQNTPFEKSHDATNVVENTSTTKPLDWDSPDDPGNPHNWSFWQRFFHSAIPALYCFALTAGSSTYVPSIPYIQREYHVSREVAILPLSMYVFGYCLGPLVAVPMAELYGRRNVYWITMICLVVFTTVAASVHDLPTIIVMRFLAGAGGSGPMAMGAGTIGDIWIDPLSISRAALFFSIAPYLGPALGTLIGAYIIAQYQNNWRWSLWVIVIVSAPVVIMAAFMKETLKSRILYLRHKKREEKVGRQTGYLKVLLIKLSTAIKEPIILLLCEPLVLAISIYTGFTFAMMFSFFASYSYVFQFIYHFNPKEVGLCFLGIMIGFFLGIIIVGACDAIFYKKAMAATPGKQPAPENRLPAAVIGSVLLPIGLFWFAWAPRKGVHWIVPVLAGIPFGASSVAIFLAMTLYEMDSCGVRYGPSAMAANGIIRYLLGGAFPLFTIQMYTGIGVHWAGSVFAFVSLLLTPIPWVMYKYGHHLRARSRFVEFRE